MYHIYTYGLSYHLQLLHTVDNRFLSYYFAKKMLLKITRFHCGRNNHAPDMVLNLNEKYIYSIGMAYSNKINLAQKELDKTLKCGQ